MVVMFKAPYNFSLRSVQEHGRDTPCQGWAGLGPGGFGLGRRKTNRPFAFLDGVLQAVPKLHLGLNLKI